MVHWGNDPDSTRGIYGGQESVVWRLWLRELGKKQIFIDPFCNYTATILGDKWIAPRPGTDAAMAEAANITRLDTQASTAPASEEAPEDVAAATQEAPDESPETAAATQEASSAPAPPTAPLRGMPSP